MFAWIDIGAYCCLVFLVVCCLCFDLVCCFVYGVGLFWVCCCLLRLLIVLVFVIALICCGLFGYLGKHISWFVLRWLVLLLFCGYCVWLLCCACYIVLLLVWTDWCLLLVLFVGLGWLLICVLYCFVFAFSCCVLMLLIYFWYLFGFIGFLGISLLIWLFSWFPLMLCLLIVCFLLWLINSVVYWFADTKMFWG